MCSCLCLVGRMFSCWIIQHQIVVCSIGAWGFQSSSGSCSITTSNITADKLMEVTLTAFTICGTAAFVSLGPLQFYLRFKRF